MTPRQWDKNLPALFSDCLWITRYTMRWNHPFNVYPPRPDSSKSKPRSYCLNPRTFYSDCIWWVWVDSQKDSFSDLHISFNTHSKVPNQITYRYILQIHIYFMINSNTKWFIYISVRIYHNSDRKSEPNLTQGGAVPMTQCLREIWPLPKKHAEPRILLPEHSCTCESPRTLIIL